jgi:branched-chain amino acid transport system permease protein
LNVRSLTWFGHAPRGAELQVAGFRFVVATVAVCTVLVRIFLLSRFGKFVDAVRENEIRVEYLGLSVRHVVFIVYVIAGALGGAGGALAALTARHVEPSFAYWTTSGEFVFVAVLGGIGNVFAPILASLLLEGMRSWAATTLPEYWQLLLGAMMLFIVLLRPISTLKKLARSLRKSIPQSLGQPST